MAANIARSMRSGALLSGQAQSRRWAVAGRADGRALRPAGRVAPGIKPRSRGI